MNENPEKLDQEKEKQSQDFERRSQVRAGLEQKPVRVELVPDAARPEMVHANTLGDGAMFLCTITPIEFVDHKGPDIAIVMGGEMTEVKAKEALASWAARNYPDVHQPVFEITSSVPLDEGEEEEEQSPV